MFNKQTVSHLLENVQTSIATIPHSSGWKDICLHIAHAAYLAKPSPIAHVRPPKRPRIRRIVTAILVKQNRALPTSTTKSLDRAAFLPPTRTETVKALHAELTAMAALGSDIRSPTRLDTRCSKVPLLRKKPKTQG